MTILLACDFEAREWTLWQPALQAALPGERLVTNPDDGPREAIDIAIVANPPAGALAGLPNLRLVQSLWAGVDRLLDDPTVPTDVPLARMVDPAMNAAMAETALWAVLGLHRGFVRYQRLQREARWAPHGQTRADETTVLVLGLGQMGRVCAQRLAAQGYRVSGWSARPRAIDGIDTHAGWAALPALLGQAQIVVSLLPLTDATRDFFNAVRLAQMRQDASLVNLARGAHVVDADLLAALDRGHLRHAVLDVFRSEPLAAGHPFWLHPRITVLPHAAAQTDARSACAVVALNVRALRAGAALADLVDRVRGY